MFGGSAEEAVYTGDGRKQQMCIPEVTVCRKEWGMSILTTHDLTESLRYEMGFTKAEAEDAVQFLLNRITDALVRGDDVWIQKYARMRLVDRPARKYLNNMTGEISTLAPGKRIRIRFSPMLLEKIDPGYGYRIGDDGEVYSVLERTSDTSEASADGLDEMDEEFVDEVLEEAVGEMEEEDELDETDSTEDWEAEAGDPQADTRAALMDFARMAGGA